MFYIFIMCGGCWVCNRTAVVDGGGAFGCPHIVASRQCGVIETVTARAVNIAGSQMIIYIAMKAPKVLYYA